MDLIGEVNKILADISLPLKVSLKFEDFDIKEFKIQKNLVNSDPFLISSDKKIKIFLRFPFYVHENDGASVICSEEQYNAFLIAPEFLIKKIKVTPLQMLEITCENCTLVAFPGLSFGWGIYQDNRQIVQHNGLDEGIEF